jgi:hypothetical protein
MTRARLRRLAPHVLGLGLALVLLVQGRSELEQAADASESFALRTATPTPIFELAPPSAAGPPPSSAFVARVTPHADALRTSWHVDDRTLPDGTIALGERGELEVPLEHLLGPAARTPGWHFIEARIDRRGGRRESVVDPILVGHFADASAPARDHSERCDISLTASEDLIEGLVVPMLEAQVLPQLHDNEHMGPDTKLTVAELELREATIRFEIEVAGNNTLAVSGLLAVWVDELRRLHLHLMLLDEVEFRGDLRTKAQSVGAGGGALIGGLIAGPLAPVGALAGWWLADDYVTDKARKTVRAKIDEGLAELSGVELLPASVELLPGEPRSRVELGFCKRTAVRPGGLVAGLWIEPVRSGASMYELGVAGPLVTGSQPSFTALDADGSEDLRVELGIDLVNALVTEWTRSGLLLELLRVPHLLEQANAEMDEWTPLKLSALVPTRPPLFTPAGGPEQGWSFGLGGLMVEATGAEQPWGQVRVGGEGTLQPLWLADRGVLKLAGSLDRLTIACEQQDAEGPVLRPCFASVLESVELRERIDARLRPEAEGMPELDLRALLSAQLQLVIAGLELSRPLPGVLRLSADVVPHAWGEPSEE